MRTVLLLTLLTLPLTAGEPIDLPTALRLAQANPIDVQVAAQRVQLAAAAYDRSRYQWLPTLQAGADYFRHDGAQQNFSGQTVESNRSSFMAGGGANAIVGFNDAIFGPLAAKQELRGRELERRSAGNDVTLAVAESYFRLLQAHGERAGALDYVKQGVELAKRTEQLAEGLALPFEANRARVELARRKQALATLTERERTAQAELARLLRLPADAALEPLEPANLTVPLFEGTLSVDLLIPMALTQRPELAAHQAFVQATLERLRQEKLRPLIPSLLLRSTSTNPSGFLAYGAFGGGSGGRVGDFRSRFDYDVQLVWELQNLGMGNRVRVTERRTESALAQLELLRLQDRIAAEVTTAVAQIESARERLAEAEPAFKDATDLMKKSVEALTQTRRLGNALVLVVRPQEVVAALQSLAQANTDYFAAVSDYNLAQFRLARALGNAPTLPEKPTLGNAPTLPEKPMPMPLPAVAPVIQPMSHITPLAKPITDFASDRR